MSVIDTIYRNHVPLIENPLIEKLNTPTISVSQIRTGKMHTACYSGSVSVAGDTMPKRVPMLNLRGYWLEKAGFIAGAPVKIEVSEKRLVVTLMT